MFEKILKISQDVLNTFCIYVPRAFMIYAGISIVHQISANLYPLMCSPLTFTGLFMSPLMIVTPHCHALQWIMNYTGDQIKTSWVWVGGYLVYYIGQNITPLIKSQFASSDNQVPSEPMDR